MTAHSLNSLGFAKPQAACRVVVALSGGVDSSFGAVQDVHDALRVSDLLRSPNNVLDYERLFREAVIDDFADSYLSGETPIPCVRCNQRVKFRDLIDTARDLGAEALATGHYVRRIDGPEGPELHRAADAARDQSYFLFATTPA